MEGVSLDVAEMFVITVGTTKFAGTELGMILGIRVKVGEILGEGDVVGLRLGESEREGFFEGCRVGYGDRTVMGDALGSVEGLKLGILL